MTPEPRIYFLIHAGVDELILQLSELRAFLCCYHKEAFPVERPLSTLDPRCWVARTLDQEMANLLHSLYLYRNAQKCLDAESARDAGAATLQEGSLGGGTASRPR